MSLYAALRVVSVVIFNSCEENICLGFGFLLLITDVTRNIRLTNN